LDLSAPPPAAAAALPYPTSGGSGPLRAFTFTTELRAGMKRFLTMAYILAVNASTLSDSGAMCTGPLRRAIPSNLGLFR
jgi:hypothetical protein